MFAGMVPLAAQADVAHPTPDATNGTAVVLPGLTRALLGAPPQQAAPAPAANGWSIVGLDDDPHSGYEVAAHAIGPNSTVVVHKRFYDVDPEAEYAAAQLVAVRTSDAGAAWTETVVDGFAPEQVSLVDGSIAVDGSGDDLYIVYHERDSGYFADMRLMYAHSPDRGETWTTGTIVDGFAGDHVGLTVVNGSTAIASYHGESSKEGLWVAATTDHGQTWQEERLVEGAGAGLYSSVSSYGPDDSYVGHYDGFAPDGTGMHMAASHDAGQTWQHQVVANRTGHYSGLGADVGALSAQAVIAAYEDIDSQTGLSTVYVSRSLDGAVTWNHTALQQDGLVGWNTDVEAIGGDEVLVTYWWGESLAGPETGRARLATSSDGGGSWAVETLPEEMYVNLYIDAAADRLATPLVAYQVWDPVTDAFTLHVAHRWPVVPPPPPPTATVLLRVEMDLGTLGDHRHVQVPLELNATYAGIEVSALCPAAFGSVAAASGGHPVASSLAVACTRGRVTESLPATMEAGRYVVVAVAAGSGPFVVEVTGTRVA